MQIIDLDAIKRKYKLQISSWEPYGTSSIWEGTYENPGEDQKVMKEEISRVYSGTFGGRFASFGNGKFKFFADHE